MKLYLIRNKKFSPKKELIFMPSGGVRGVSGITSIVGGKNGKLPYVVLDSDKSGKDAGNKLKSSLYSGDLDKLLYIGTFIDLDNSEVEDLIPFSVMEKQIDKVFRDVDDEDFSDVYDSSIPIVPQIERFAKEHNIALGPGWKVILAKAVRFQLEKKDDIEKTIIDKWVKLFTSFNEE